MAKENLYCILRRREIFPDETDAGDGDEPWTLTMRTMAVKMTSIQDQTTGIAITENETEHILLCLLGQCDRMTVKPQEGMRVLINTGVQSGKRVLNRALDPHALRMMHGISH